MGRLQNLASRTRVRWKVRAPNALPRNGEVVIQASTSASVSSVLRQHSHFFTTAKLVGRSTHSRFPQLMCCMGFSAVATTDAEPLSYGPNVIHLFKRPRPPNLCHILPGCLPPSVQLSINANLSFPQTSYNQLGCLLFCTSCNRHSLINRNATTVIPD